MIVIISNDHDATMDDQTALRPGYGVMPVEAMASMAGIDVVRGIFDGTLPQPPIMQGVEPFDCAAVPGMVAMHSLPTIHHYNPIGSVHGGYAAILLGSAMGLAVHSMLPPGAGYSTLEFKISFIRGMSTKTGTVRTEGKVLNVGRRAATAEARITDARGRLSIGARHHHLPCFRDSDGRIAASLSAHCARVGRRWISGRLLWLNFRCSGPRKRRNDQLRHDHS